MLWINDVAITLVDCKNQKWIHYKYLSMCDHNAVEVAHQCQFICGTFCDQKQRRSTTRMFLVEFLWSRWWKSYLTLGGIHVCFTLMFRRVRAKELVCMHQAHDHFPELLNPTATENIPVRPCAAQLLKRKLAFKYWRRFTVSTVGLQTNNSEQKISRLPFVSSV